MTEGSREVFVAVVNDEEQYSVWPADTALPRGWTDAGCRGTRDECLDFIAKVWTDMRPRSVRNTTTPASGERGESAKLPPTAFGDDLVRRLEHAQPIKLASRPNASRDALERAVERGFVRVVFLPTGTELGIEIARDESDHAGADFAAGTGSLSIVGRLVLNGVNVRFRGELDVATLEGSGRLERI